MITSSYQVNSSIGELVRKAEQDYISGTTHRSKYVDTSLYEDISTIDAYLNSTHISGKEDSLGREKPFYNMVTMARNVWYRATDIDRKNIIIPPAKIKNTISAYLESIKLQEWMKKERFGSFLNKWGLVLAGYNMAVVKIVEQDGKLPAVVVPWNRIICDEIDFDNNPKIEIIELTPAQLKRRKGYDKKLVKQLLDAVSARENQDSQDKDTKSNYIKLYEIHGEFPLSYITGKEEDEDKYVQQMQVVSFLESKEDGKFDDYTLIAGRETNDPYMLTWLIPSDDGSISLWGSVKNLFEAQWMANHNAKAIKDYLDIAGKLIYQTSDGNFVGQNVLNAIENGDILIHAANQPLTQLATSFNNIVSLQNYGQQWETLGTKINGISESMLGQNPPSGTAWRQTEALLTESHSLFELMTEEKGLHIEEMMNRFVIPHLKKKLKNKDEIVAELDAHGIDKIDEIFIKNTAIKRANKKIVDMTIKAVQNNTQLPTQEDQNMIMGQEQQSVKEMLSGMGNNRFFKPDDLDEKIWEEVLDDWGEAQVDVTGEAKDKQTIMTTLNSVLMVIAKNPAILQDPNAKMIFNEILNATGAISPLQLKEAQTINQPQMPMQQQAQAVIQ